jgi:uncharacterized membrane protein
VKNKFLNWVKNNIEWVLLTFAVLAIISPIIFTRSWAGLDFSKTGQIGETIGGLVSPILNFLTIILLYLAFKEQMEANTIQKENDKTSRDYDLIFKQFSELKQEFESIKLSVLKENSEFTYIGIRGIFEFKNILENCTNVTDCVGEYSVRAFCLSYTYMSSNLFFLLRRSFSSSLSKADKEAIYTTLVQIRTPLLIIALASAIYIKKKMGNQSEVDKIIAIQSILAGQFQIEFETYNPQKLGN